MEVLGAGEPLCDPAPPHAITTTPITITHLRLMSPRIVILQLATGGSRFCVRQNTVSTLCARN